MRLQGSQGPREQQPIAIANLTRFFGPVWAQAKRFGAAAARWLAQKPLLLVTAIALVARLLRLTWLGLWTNEGFSVFLAQSSLRALVIGTANDLHPPLFYLLLKLWLLPGQNLVWLRLLPVAFGTLTVVLVYHVGRRLLGPAVGWWAALFLALAPKHIAYSREARMYIVLAFFTLLSLYLLWRCLEDPFPGCWSGYVAATLAMMYTQNLGLVFVPGELVIAIVLLAKQRHGQQTRAWLISQALILLGYAPWLPVMVEQTLFRRLPWIEAATLLDLRISFPHILLGVPPLRGVQQDPWQLAAYLWLVVVVGAGALFLVRRKEIRVGLWLGLALLLPAGTLLALMLLLPLYQEQQLLVLAAPLALLAGVGVASLPKVGRLAVLGAFLGLVAMPWHSIYFRPIWGDQAAAEGWRELAAYLDAHAAPGDALVINPAAAAPSLDFYLQTRLDRVAYPRTYDPLIGSFVGEVTTPEIVEVRLRPLAEQHRRIWLIECCMPTYWDPAGLIPAWLEAWGQPQPLPPFEGIQVRLYERSVVGGGDQSSRRQRLFLLPRAERHPVLDGHLRHRAGSDPDQDGGAGRGLARRSRHLYGCAGQSGARRPVGCRAVRHAAGGGRLQHRSGCGAFQPRFAHVSATCAPAGGAAGSHRPENSGGLWAA